MLNQLNQIINYIEDHLTDNLPLDTISNKAGMPLYHLSMIFYYLSSHTLSEYIKNRKLSEANKELLGGEKVTDIAFKYGYSSVDGFTRAFKKYAGHLPSEVVKKGIAKSFPKLSFTITVKGGISMEFKIVEKPAFNLVGVTRRIPMQFEGVNNHIVELAKSITEAQRKKMHTLQDIEPKQIINASYDADANFLKEEGCLTHLIGVLTTKEDISENLEKVPVPACTWAVFPNQGPFPATLQQTMANIYAQWLPASGYRILNIPTFSFTKMDKQKKDYAYSEVWVPAQKI